MASPHAALHTCRRPSPSPLPPRILLRPAAAATLDFASLYPSIMMAHNLCYSTLLAVDDVKQGRIPEADYEKTPDEEFYFARWVMHAGHFSARRCIPIFAAADCWLSPCVQPIHLSTMMQHVSPQGCAAHDPGGAPRRT